MITTFSCFFLVSGPDGQLRRRPPRAVVNVVAAAVNAAAKGKEDDLSGDGGTETAERSITAQVNNLPVPVGASKGVEAARGRQDTPKVRQNTRKV